LKREEGGLILVLGGARSGKSSFAQKKAAMSGLPVTYVATALATDEEMRLRIKEHRKSRPSRWTTVEAPFTADEKIISLCREQRVIIWDCVTVFVANLLIKAGEKKTPPAAAENEIVERLERMAAEIKKSQAVIIAVANEVGMGVVPEYPLGREFRDVAGRVNQLLAAEANEVFLVVAGLPVELKKLQFVFS